MPRQFNRLAAALLLAAGILPAPAAWAVPFSSCDQAYAAGAAPLYAGQPGYSTRLDRDGDGVACELAGGAAPAVTAPPPASPPASTRYALAACYDSTANPITAQPSGVAFYCRFHALNNLQWSQWGPGGATATGDEFMRTNCDPSCANGQTFQNPVILRASNPQPAPPDVGCPTDVLFFTDITISYPASAPPTGSLALSASSIDGPSFITDNGLPAVHYPNHEPFCLQNP